MLFSCMNECNFFTLTSKNYKLEVQGDKVVMLKDAYLSYANMVAFVEQGAGASSSISYYDNWKQKNPYMNGPEYIVPATKTKYGWTLGTQKTNSKWSYNYEFGPFSTSTDDGKWLENHMSYASEIVTESSLYKEFFIFAGVLFCGSSNNPILRSPHLIFSFKRFLKSSV